MFSDHPGDTEVRELLAFAQEMKSQQRCCQARGCWRMGQHMHATGFCNLHQAQFNMIEVAKTYNPW